MGDVQPVAVSHVPPPVVADAAMLSVFSSAMEARILLYCVVVATSSDSITMVLLVAALDRGPKWKSNCSTKEARAPMTWPPCGPAVVGSDILWKRAAECAEPKASLRPVASLDSCSSDFWRGRN